MEFKTIITRVGLAKIANATAMGMKLNLKYMAFGDGGGDYPNINENMTALAGEKYRGEINNIKIDESEATNIKISKVVPASVGGFFVREIGVFDEAKDLIAVGLFPETYKPTIEEGATKDLIANMIISVANAQTIELKTDPNVIVATMKDLEDLRDEIGTGSYIDETTKREFEIVFRDNRPCVRVLK